MSSFLNSYGEQTLTTIINWSFSVATIFILFGAAAGVVSHLANNRRNELAADSQRAADQERQEALDDAAAAVQRAERAETQAADAETQAAQANERADAAHAQVEEAQAQVDAAEARVDTLEDLTTPRSLDAGQRAELGRLLVGPPNGRVTVTAVLGLPDSVSFARELLAVLQTAGWDTGGFSQSVFSTPPTGIIVQMTVPAGVASMNEVDRSRLPVHGKRLVDALIQVGIAATGGVVPEGEGYGQDVQLIVGVRRHPDASR